MRGEKEKLKTTKLKELVREVEDMQIILPSRIKSLCEVAKDPVASVYLQMLGLEKVATKHISDVLYDYKRSHGVAKDMPLAYDIRRSTQPSSLPKTTYLEK